MRREQAATEQRKIYHSSGTQNIEGGALPNVKQWMINRYFEIEKDWASIYKRNWDWIINNLDNLGPTNCSLKFKNIKRDLEPMFTLQGIDCYLEEVSAGLDVYKRQPYKRPMTKAGCHECYKDVDEEYLDIVICPE